MFFIFKEKNKIQEIQVNKSRDIKMEPKVSSKQNSPSLHYEVHTCAWGGPPVCHSVFSSQNREKPNHLKPSRVCVIDRYRLIVPEDDFFWCKTESTHDKQWGRRGPPVVWSLCFFLWKCCFNFYKVCILHKEEIRTVWVKCHFNINTWRKRLFPYCSVCVGMHICADHRWTHLPRSLGFINHCPMGAEIVSSSRNAQDKRIDRFQALEATTLLNNGSATE